LLCLFSDRQDLHYHTEPADRTEIRNSALVNPDDPPSIDLRLPYWELDFPPLTVSPIAGELASYDLVCLVPHDVLHSLPIHAFRSTPIAKSLVEVVTVAYLPSASLVRFCLRKRTPNVGNSLVYGNPQRSDQTPIPRSETEAVFVARLLCCEAVIGLAATRAGIEGKAESAEYLHLACHCKFCREDPLGSALMLSDDNLAARDVFRCRLNPRLVVLSACESGISKVQAGDEAIGLVRAFLFAGTPAVIVSLWNAYDISAAEIMEDFYLGYARDGKSKAVALAEAQRKQVRKGTKPSQWAPFILIGDWR
jgi:CHAT domain-containing protein